MVISLIFPILNEELMLPHLFERISKLRIELSNLTFEIIYIDDGSTDQSLNLLRAFSSSNENVKVISLSRNFGHQSALLAGLQRATGDAVIILDADLQDPPELIPSLIEAYKSGFDVVSTVKRSRGESMVKRFFYFSFYRIAKLLNESDVLLDSGDFCLLSKRTVEVINSLPERQIYLRGLRSWVGFRHKQIFFDRPKRIYGETKYSVGKLIRLALDGILSFSILPLRLVSLLGVVILLLSALFFCYSVYVRLVLGTSPSGFTAIIGLLLLTSGAQLISLGIIGEYIGRIYREVKNRPRFVVSEEIGSNAKLFPISGDMDE